MVGDFNVTLDENLERFNYCYREIRNVRFRTKRCEVLEEFELEDIWRIRPLLGPGHKRHPGLIIFLFPLLLVEKLTKRLM